ncbi:hypothetical protein BKE38_09825 [Pseudoroseomonas deserti]|uniref:PhnA-like protein n=1 Tax=Teichococcus deserti TaxID=1817963 RepID=A0A1V2H4N4_9PROT|nr:hypothetical protein BKE38_09825 [Pseudoroseomonas deserti]
MSWGAVLAGAAIAITTGLTLNLLGAAVGATLVDATARDTPGATSFGIGAAAWLLVSNLIGLGLGGYAAARLSGSPDRTDGALHGLTVWATSILVSALLLGNLASGIAHTAVSSASSLLGGVAQGAGSVVSTAGEQAANRTSNQTLQSGAQALVDRVQNALSGGGDPASMTPDQRKAEMARLAAKRVSDGSLTAPDRERLTALVAAEYGISPQEAQQRIQQAEQQVQQATQEAEQRARAAADATAKGAAWAAFSAFVTLLLSAIVALLGARRGTSALRASRL